MTNATQTKPDLKTLPEIRDMALELEGLAQALDIIMQENETPGRRLACCTLAEVVMTRSEAVSRALDEFTSNGGG